MRKYAGILLMFLVVATLGCGGGGDFPVAQATGVVMCEGQPVPHVMVFFEPLADGKSAMVGKQGIGIADESGKFVISTYGDRDGAVVGKHRVRVGPPNADLHPGVQCPCVLNSEVDIMEVDVKKGEKNEFELTLKKKAAKEALSLEEREAILEEKFK